MKSTPNELGIKHDYPTDPARRLPIFDMSPIGPQFYIVANEGFTWAWERANEHVLEGSMSLIPSGHYHSIVAYHKRCTFNRGQLVIEWRDLSAPEYRIFTDAASGDSVPLAGYPWWDWMVVAPEPNIAKWKSALRERGRANRYADAKAAAEQLSREQDSLTMVVRTIARKFGRT